jgi:hypothetical protein
VNRIDELTLKLADGSIAIEERRELEGLIRGNPEAAQAHASMLDLIASLRGESPGADVTQKVLDRIHERISEKIEVGVLRKIRARSALPAARAVVPSRRPIPWIMAVAAAAAILVAVAVAVFSPAREEKGDEGIAQRPPKVVVPSPPAPPKEEPPAPKKEEKAPPPVEPLKIEKPAPSPPAPEKKPNLPAPPADPKPAPPPSLEVPKPAPPAETAVVVATLEKAEGVDLVVNGQKRPAKAGAELLEGQGFEVGEKGEAVVRYADGTRFDLRPRSAVRGFTLKEGKSVELQRGILAAQVAEQAADRPFVILTPQAEVRVVGTTLRVSVDPEADGATHVEVTEGKVRVRRLSDGKTVDVARSGAVLVSKGTAALAAHPATGLLAHWTLDEKAGTKALDSSGNLFHAELKGETGWTAGRIGGGLRLGPGGFLSVRGFQAPEAFTVSFWVYQAKLNADQDWFLNFGSNDFFLMREGNMDPRQVRTGFENPQQFLTVASVVQARQWVHIAVTFDGAETRLYENGGLVGNKKMTRREIHPDATFGRVGPGSEVVMDDIRIYDRAVPATDIQRILAGVHPVPAGRR